MRIRNIVLAGVMIIIILGVIIIVYTRNLYTPVSSKELELVDDNILIYQEPKKLLRKSIKGCMSPLN